ncbi:angiopoietin-related protein 7-like [Venturia canescens]|uniref:angiopoietin-related protein 7-like n=1 Tax=Venturia canescens TaxID=32260 RepID=UPI001C9CAC80|nr:angiopoietin-related protein 7-like [Venturia canescens]
MCRLKGLGLCWTVLIFLPDTWTMPLMTHTNFVNLKKGLISNKPGPVTLSTVLEILRSDMKKIQTTLDTTAEKFDKLEKNLSNIMNDRKNRKGTTLEGLEKRNDSEGNFNTTINFTNEYLNTYIFTNKLERMSKIQERNSRLLVLEMTSLTNLEESVNRLENLINSTRSNVERDVSDSKLSTYQERVVDWLASIDKRLHGIPLLKIDDLHSTLKVNSSATKNNRTVKIFPNGNENSTTERVYRRNFTVRSCDGLRDDKNFRSGIFFLDKNDAATKMIWANVSRVSCDMETNGGGWTIIQRRGGPFEGRVDFNRSWNEYANGFGDLEGEFWFGNEVVHRMTFYHGQYELRIDLEDWEGQNVWAQYSDFELGTRMDGYRIKVAGYTGNATDSLSAHYSTPFSTYDRRNDYSPECCPCTSDYGGGWWYYSCFEANLNGNYYTMDQYREPYRGIIWEHWRDDYSLKSTKMMIRLKYRDSLNRI